MATYVIYSGSADHGVISSDATYATARAGSGSLSDGTVNDVDSVGQSYVGSIYYVYQGFITFDTSGVPSDTPTTNPTLTIQASYVSASVAVKVGVRAWTGGTGDFVAGASLSSVTSFGNQTISGTGSKTFTGPSDVARSATYRLMLWDNNQQANTAPASEARIQYKNSRATGTTNDPYLTIVIPNVGAGAITEENDTLSAAGETTIEGAASITEEGDTTSSSGLNLVIADAAISEGDDAASATAILSVYAVTPAGRTLKFEASTMATRTIRLI